MGKKALLIYGPFTYIMEVPKFADKILISKPLPAPTLVHYMSEEESLTLPPSNTKLIFQPVGHVDEEILLYRFVREEG